MEGRGGETNEEVVVASGMSLVFVLLSIEEVGAALLGREDFGGVQSQ